MADTFQRLHDIVEETRYERHLKTAPEAFVHFCLRVVLKLSDEQIDSAVTHGEKDAGIDAIHIDDEGVHIVVCDYADTRFESGRTFPRSRIDQFTRTCLGIVTSEIQRRDVNEILWSKIGEVRRYWHRIDSTYIPHTFYFITSRKTLPNGRARIESKLNYYMTNSYCYLGQDAILMKLRVSDWCGSKSHERSDFELALECEGKKPNQALELYTLLERENVHYYVRLLPVSIIGPVLSMFAASYFAPLFQEYRELAAGLIMIAGYFPAVILFQREEIRRGFKSGDPSWWLLSIGIFVVHVLAGNVLILVIALLGGAILAEIVMLPLKLLSLFIDFRLSGWISWPIVVAAVLFVFALIFSGMYCPPLPRWRYLPAIILTGAKRNRKDIESFIVGVAISASVVGGGAFGLLFEFRTESIGVALLTGIAFGLGYRSHVGHDPILENLNRLGQARCFLRLRKRASAYCRLREVLDSPDFAAPWVIRKLAEALIAHAGQSLGKDLDPRYHAAHFLIQAEASAARSLSHKEAIEANLHESWALVGVDSLRNLGPSDLISITRDPAVPTIRRVLATEAIANWTHLGKDHRFLEESEACLANEPMLGFVEIPAGPFLMGEGQKRHEVTLPSFYMARYPVTVEQITVYESSTGKHVKGICTGGLKSPHTMLEWEDAVQYSEWLNEQLIRIAIERLKKPINGTEDRLFWEAIHRQTLSVTIPSEAEWEKAARGTDGRRFPWGNEADPDLANFWETGIHNRCSVGCFITGSSPYGVEDLMCSGEQWTRSQYADYPYDPNDGREHFHMLAEGVRRGSGIGTLLKNQNCAHRIRAKRDSYLGDGLRVAISPFRSA